MTSIELERRHVRLPIESRASDDGAPRIGGYALKFNALSRNLGGFVEQIHPTALNKSSGDGWPNVMARYNHEMLLGSIAGGSLRLSVDGVGLDYEVDLLDDDASMRIFKLAQRGDVSKSSFAAYMHESDWSQTPDGFPLRTVTAMSLVDVAPVDDPAYFDTSTGLRSLAEARSMDVTEVEALAQAGRLADLIPKAPTVIDLGARSQDSVVDEQGETHSPGYVLALRQRLELLHKPTS